MSLKTLWIINAVEFMVLSIFVLLAPHYIETTVCLIGMACLIALGFWELWKKETLPNKEMKLVLEGKIFFQDGDIKEEIDGKVVLQLLLYAMKEGLDLMELENKK